MRGVGSQTLLELVARLPPAKFVFAYGSAVKPQSNQNRNRRSESRPLVDLCVCVPAEETASWHERNLSQNGDHYSLLGRLGGDFLARYQRALPAQVYFNTLVPAADLGLLFKYGVVAESDLVDDLDRWTHLYFAGRLHKPVDVLVPSQSPQLDRALKRNSLSALRAALLLLPQKFTPFQLFHTVSDLSYSGDFRMTFGENKNKVSNIVTSQLNEFVAAYESPLAELSECVRRLSDGTLEQDASVQARFRHLSHLPSTPKSVLSKLAERSDREDAMEYVAAHADCPRLVKASIRQIVWQSSVRQSIKGILTAGFFKSLQYSGRKITKMFA